MDGPTVTEILLGLLPMLLLFGVFYIFARLYGGRSKEHVAVELRKVEALERIAGALEKRQ